MNEFLAGKNLLFEANKLRLSPSSTIIWIILSRNWDEAEFVIGNCLAFLRFSRSGIQVYWIKTAVTRDLTDNRL